MDTTHVKLRSSNIVFILLHRDPLISKHEVSDSSMEYCLEEMSSLFFSHMEKFTMHSLFGLSGEDFRDSLLTTCCYDHIRFVFFFIVYIFIIIVFNQKRNVTGIYILLQIKKSQ